MKIRLPAPPEDWGPQKPEGISLCMIVRDEEATIGDCLESVLGSVDEVCIVDTGSTDGTLDVIARYRERFSAFRLEHIVWPDDFSAARNVALGLATRRWVFTLDADERLDSDSGAALRTLYALPAAKILLHCRIHNAVVGEESTSAVVSHSLPRLHPNHPDLRYIGRIHERLDASSPGWEAIGTPIRIQHGGYDGDFVERKRTRNGPMILREVEQHPEDPFTHFNAGNYLISIGNVDRGIEHLQKMRWLQEGQTPRIFTPTGYVTLAAALAHRGDLQEAHAVADLCLSVAPRYTLAHFVKGEVYTCEGKLAEARAAFERTVEMGQTEDLYLVVDEEIPRWKAPYNIGALYARERDYPNAITWFARALAAKPGVALIAQDLMRSSYAEIIKAVHEGRHDAALILIEQTIERLGETNGPLAFASALTMWHAGRWSDARKSLAADEVIAREDEAARDFMLATLLYREGKYEDAAAVLGSADYPEANGLREAIALGGERSAFIPSEQIACAEVALYKLTAQERPLVDVAGVLAVRRDLWRMADAAALMLYFSGSDEARMWCQRYDAGADIATALLYGREDAMRSLVEQVLAA